MSCIGVFRSVPIAAGLDPVLHRSGLVVIWFQSGSVVPAGEDVDPTLRGMSWPEVAEDYEL